MLAPNATHCAVARANVSHVSMEFIRRCRLNLVPSFAYAKRAREKMNEEMWYGWLRSVHREQLLNFKWHFNRRTRAHGQRHFSREYVSHSRIVLEICQAAVVPASWLACNLLLTTMCHLTSTSSHHSLSLAAHTIIHEMSKSSSSLSFSGCCN